MRTQHPTRNGRSPRGFSIAEVMLSLSITSMLLVGASAAYSASAAAVDGNDRFFRTTQAARVTMTQLLTEIRRADKIDTGISAPYNTVFVTRDPDLRIAEEDYRVFKYEAAAKAITMQVIYKPRPDGTVLKGSVYTLCRNVEEASFGPAAKVGTVEVCVPMTLVVKSNGHSIRLSDTSGPRRAL